MTFVMLNRLAEVLLRTRPQILRALRVTYPYVFIDEFQDTTYAQYDFLLSAFGGGQTVVTAVGNDKQRIMTWAGARVDAFARFEADFGARRIPLLFNFRSSPDLVRIQHVVARALDGNAPRMEAQADRQIDGEAAQVWSFETETAEATQIAAWVSEDMRRRGRAPRDYALLVRQTADRFEKQFRGPLAAVGLGLRNESLVVGRTTLQDLLVEKFTGIALAILRLGPQQHAPRAWETAFDAVLRLRNVDPEDEVVCRRTENAVKHFLTTLRAGIAVRPSAEAVNSLVNGLVGFPNPGALAQVFVEYGTGESLGIAIEAFRLHLATSAENSADWVACLDAFEGVDKLPLMTVHKSKGLEYDAILFIGLDDKMWWGHSAANPEGVATFFVALSRAKQRAIFTFCQERDCRTRVADLYRLLADAGVPEVTFS